MENDVVVYYANGCGACEKVKEFLHDKGVDFREEHISEKISSKEKDGIGAMKVPQTCKEGEEDDCVHGYDPVRLNNMFEKE